MEHLATAYDLHFLTPSQFRHMLRVCVIICFSFVLFIDSFAQTQSRPVSLGVSGLFGSNFSTIGMKEFSGQEFCGTFGSGAAGGSGFGVEAEFPLGASLSFTPQILYRDLSSQFKTLPFNIEHSRDLTTFDTVRIQRERIYTTSVHAAFIVPTISWRPISRLRFDLGVALGILTNHHYDKAEKLLTPNAVYTSNNLSEIQLENGDFIANKFQAMLQTSLGYDMPLSHRVNISPKFHATYPITSLSTTNNSNYRTISVSGGITLSYSILSSPEILPLQPKEEPKPIISNTPIAKVIIPEPSILRVVVRTVGITESGEEVSEPVVAIENIRVTDVSPTLNYMFFDDGKAELPDRYNKFSTRNETKGYSLSTFYKLDALGIHYELLNIIGKRLQDRPASKITLTGTRSQHSSGDSIADNTLSIQRAANVGRYFEDVWGIEPSRIKLKSRTLPEQPSDEFTATGQQENRRVEITSNDAHILEPIETKRIERTATPPRIKFYPDITSNANGVKSITVVVKQGNKILERTDGLNGSSGSQPENSQNWMWNINSESVIADRDSVTWEMDVVDSNDHTAHVSGNIRIRRNERTTDITKRDTTIDKTLERFHLLLFDYSSANSKNAENLDGLLDRISTAIGPDSRITLIGHTDKTGDPNFNERLSLERATRTSLLLSSKLRSRTGFQPVPQFSIEGRGAKDILFDNTNPEGRFLSRTVRISIERDVK